MKSCRISAIGGGNKAPPVAPCRATPTGEWMRKAVAIAVLGVVGLAACTAKNGITTGAVPAGANPGVVIDSPIASGGGEPLIGPLEGALQGADVGLSLSEADRKIALNAEYEALEYGRTGQPTRWRNRRSGNAGEVSVGSTYQVNRLDCREYTHKVSIGGRNRVVRGTACRQPDGVWRVLG